MSLSCRDIIYQVTECEESLIYNSQLLW